MNVNDLLLAWANSPRMQKFYGKRLREAAESATSISIEVESRDSGYCETCSSPYSAVVVYAVSDKGKRTELYEYAELNINEFLEMVLNPSKDEEEDDSW